MDTLPSKLEEALLAPYPETLVLDWTDYCNAQCFFCYREKYEQQIGGKGEFIPFAKLRKLERALRHVKVFGISSGIGEPLLHPELDEIFRWLYDINPKILIRTTTNGTALTADKASFFAGHLDWLSVSLNAANGEAHMRDMFPHLAKRGIDAEKRWELHLRHLSDFVAALPAADRPKVRFQMVAHRYNIEDIPDFVRLTARLGGSHAVITNIAVHAETVDWSLYWLRDRYNELVDEACAIGTRIGVRVDAARFFTSIKPVLDLDEVCRDPVDTAYISRASVGAPCCQWAEAGIPTSVYDDEAGFDRYWNHDILRRLRQKRNFDSCRVCGMSRVFDEVSFHFSPKLKQDLMAEGRLEKDASESDFPDAALVRRCVENNLDLPSIRYCLLKFNLPVERAAPLAADGLQALPALEQACWEAFRQSDLPMVDEIDAPLAGPLLGIGWGPPIHEPQNRRSGRRLGNAQSACLFLRVLPGLDSELRFTLHHVSLPGLEARLKISVCGQPVETRLSLDEVGQTVLGASVPQDILRAHGGRLWIRIGVFEVDASVRSAMISFTRMELSQTRAIEIAHMARPAFARAVLRSLAAPTAPVR